MRKLHLSKELALPIDAVTQTFAILAKKRRGKTYTASVMAEEMCKAGLPFVAMDPTGAWWGIRATADGAGPGFPVVIIGGPHGDIPLEPTAGKVIADLVVDHPSFYVIDLSEMNSNAEQDRFAMEFGERLYRAKAKKKFPMHLFVDEADCFLPQQPMPDQRRLLGAFDTIVRRGGIRGIGVTLISQRPAVCNKNVLSQVECLIVLQIIGSQDREAIEKWVKGHGTKSQCNEMLESLAALGLGEAWFWSPAWLDVFKRVQVRERETFNSSATPEVGSKIAQPKVLAKVELDAIRAQVAETIERVRAEDPQLLRKRIAELEAQLRKAPAAATTKVEVREKKVPIIEDKQVERLGQVAAKVFAVTEKVSELREDVVRLMAAVNTARLTFNREAKAYVAYLPAAAPRAPQSGHGGPRARPAPSGDASPLRAGEKAILTAVAQHEDGVTREQLTVLTGYKRSSRDTYLQKLSSGGFVEYRGDLILATGQGVEALGSDFEPLPVGDELRKYWLNELPEGERRVLEVALEAYPNEVSRETISETTGYKRSSRDTYLQKLSARRLVTSSREGVRASDVLFSEGKAA